MHRIVRAMLLDVQAFQFAESRLNLLDFRPRLFAFDSICNGRRKKHESNELLSSLRLTITVENDSTEQREFFHRQFQSAENAAELKESVSVAAEGLAHQQLFVHRGTVGKVQFIFFGFVTVGETDQRHFVNAQLKQMRAFLNR